MGEVALTKNMLPEVFMRHKEVIKLIPDVKPTNTYELFSEIIFSNMLRDIQAEDPSLRNMLSSDPVFDISSEEAEWSELKYVNGFSERIVITTVGAKLLIRLFQAGLIEQKRKSSSKDLSLLQDYANSLPQLLEKSDQIKKQRTAEVATDLALMKVRESRIRHLIECPEDAVIEELNREFLNKYAFAIGPGDQSFKFSGADVVKTVSVMKSNSGKNRTYTVCIQWTMADGTRYGDVDVEPVLNRRNDPERNWGLGRG